MSTILTRLLGRPAQTAEHPHQGSSKHPDIESDAKPEGEGRCGGHAGKH